MSRRIYIYVNGILTVPGESKNWNNRAVTWTHIHTQHRAESLEYLSSVITRPIFEKQRAAKLAHLLTIYMINGQWEVVLVGHSNGCDVVLDALTFLGWPEIHSVFLIAAACDSDFRRNGLNSAVTARLIRNLFVWVDPKDRMLWAASTPIGHLLGFGDLGRTGPRNLAPEAAKRVYIRRCDTGHSGCWEENIFHETMTRITNPSVN